MHEKKIRFADAEMIQNVLFTDIPVPAFPVMDGLHRRSPHNRFEG
jgi:hypothetical protein